MSMQDDGWRGSGGGQRSGVGKDQKWSTVELRCQPATGSSIIMVIFRRPSASHRQRAEKEIEQRERVTATQQEGKEQREQRCYCESSQFTAQKHETVCGHVYYYSSRHEITVQGAKQVFFYSLKNFTVKTFTINGSWC